MRCFAFPLLVLFAGCDTPTAAEEPPFLRGEQPAYAAPPPVLRRLTYSQYVHSIDDLFGPGLVLPGELEPDTRAAGLYAVGASLTSISALGVDRYESAAYAIAEQVLADPARRAALVDCVPVSSADVECAREVLAALGERVWRRPPTDAELDSLVRLTTTAGTTLDSFDLGLSFGLAALLQSPYFLFRVELGEVAPSGGYRYTSAEMASRLSYFLWDGPPDETLLAAAERGELVTDAGLQAEVDRMLADERTHRGLRAFFGDMLHLDQLDSLTKDPNLFVYMSSDLGPAAREQTLQDIDAIVLEADVDFRTFLTSSDTHIDRTLAALYDVPAPVREGFGLTTLPIAGGRRGYLGQASFLALQAHATSTSVTLRGLYLREVLLCQEMPSPPAGLNTSIPAANDERPTMRDRVTQHLEDPSCAGCHQLMDPIGLGFEHFDGVGRWRDTESGHPIDTSGSVDGDEFVDAWGLGQVVADHLSFAPCVSDTLLRSAVGRTLADDERALAEWHADGLHQEGYRLRWLFRDIVLGPAFRTAGVVQ